MGYFTRQQQVNNMPVHKKIRYRIIGNSKKPDTLSKTTLIANILLIYCYKIYYKRATVKS